MSFVTKSLSGCLWKQKLASERKAEVISQRYSLPFQVSRILAGLDIDVEDVASFLDPKLSNLMPNPSVLKDMDKASSRIADAIIKKEKIGIIGDYDVDGATSSALLRLFLEEFELEVTVHIPDRDEGYGPSKLAFDEFLKNNIKFVMTTDCGTSAFEPFSYAKSKGFDVIVIDHHEAEVLLPEAYAIVNPQRLDCENLPVDLKYLAAVGVVFMVVVAVNRELRNRGFYEKKSAPDLMKFLDIVAFGTVCDVVPLVGLNRAFVSQGLKVIAQRSNLGMKTLIDKAEIKEKPTAFHLGYVLGPRVNAGGRVGQSYKGSALLCAKNEQVAQGIADELNEYNKQRKDIEEYVMLKAIEQLEGSPQEYPIAFVFADDWHQGVIGIVAGKLKERYNVPAFVMSIEGGDVKGSSRSIKGVDLGSLIISAKEKGIITKGGGHFMAAGFSLRQEKIAEFRGFVGEYVKNKIGDEGISPVVEYDGVLDILGANVEFIDSLSMLEPYGAGNLEPKFVIKDIRVAKASTVGMGHVKCFFTSIKGGNLNAMAFRCADSEMGMALLSGKGDLFNIVGMLRKDNWQGKNSVQFIIEDVMRV